MNHGPGAALKLFLAVYAEMHWIAPFLKFLLLKLFQPARRVVGDRVRTVKGMDGATVNHAAAKKALVGQDKTMLAHRRLKRADCLDCV